MDRLSSQHRSWNMGRIKSKDTGPELTVRRLLHGLGYRFRLHSRIIPGKPDIVLPMYHTVIFVHGCFWHRHRACKYASSPKTNVAFWHRKFRKNVVRDKKVQRELLHLGWHVIVVWECQTQNAGKLQDLLKRYLPRKPSTRS